MTRRILVVALTPDELAGNTPASSMPGGGVPRF